jgi:hypothetical protein
VVVARNDYAFVIRCLTSVSASWLNLQTGVSAQNGRGGRSGGQQLRALALEYGGPVELVGLACVMISQVMGFAIAASTAADAVSRAARPTNQLPELSPIALGSTPWRLLTPW